MTNSRFDRVRVKYNKGIGYLIWSAGSASVWQSSSQFSQTLWQGWYALGPSGIVNATMFGHIICCYKNAWWKNCAMWNFTYSHLHKWRILYCTSGHSPLHLLGFPLEATEPQKLWIEEYNFSSSTWFHTVLSISKISSATNFRSRKCIKLLRIFSSRVEPWNWEQAVEHVLLASFSYWCPDLLSFWNNL